jgi:hypothetical protein
MLEIEAADSDNALYLFERAGGHLAHVRIYRSESAERLEKRIRRIEGGGHPTRVASFSYRAWCD